MSEMGVGLSELPDGWVWTTLGEVSQPPQYGWTTSAQNRGKLRLLRTTDITSGSIDWETVPFCQKEPDDKTKYLLKDGDVVISRAGSVGFSCLIREPEQAVFASYLIRFRPVIIDELFLSYFLKSPAYWLAISESKLGIVIQNVNATKLKKIALPIAPLPEQHRIVAKIEELFTKLDAGINELYKAQSQLKRYRQSVLKAAFEGKLTESWRAEHQDEIEPASVLLARILKARRKKWEAEQLEQMQARGKMPKDNKWKARYKEPIAPDMSELPKLPRGWIWTTVGSIGLVASGQTPKGINDLNLDGEIPFYKVSDMNKPGNERFMRAAEITLDDDQTARLGIHIRDQGTVIFPKRGGAIATNKKRILSCPSAYDLNIMGVLPYIVPTDFFYQWLLSINLAALSDGSNVPQLNHKNIDPLPFPLPPLPEQQAIVSEVESRLSVADAVEKTVTAELKRAEQLRQSILKNAFSGKLVPQDPNDEPATALLERIKAEKPKHIQRQRRLKLV